MSADATSIVVNTMITIPCTASIFQYTQLEKIASNVHLLLSSLLSLGQAFILSHSHGASTCTIQTIVNTRAYQLSVLYVHGQINRENNYITGPNRRERQPSHSRDTASRSHQKTPLSGHQPNVDFTPAVTRLKLSRYRS